MDGWKCKPGPSHKGFCLKLDFLHNTSVLADFLYSNLYSGCLEWEFDNTGVSCGA